MVRMMLAFETDLAYCVSEYLITDNILGFAVTRHGGL